MRRPGVGGASKVDDGRFGVRAWPDPGCLKMPKLRDFFSGRILQEMVCSSLTLTQRTMYDFYEHVSQRDQVTLQSVPCCESQAAPFPPWRLQSLAVL